MFSELHFIRPYWFIALAPLAFLFWLLAKQHLVNKHWENLCDPELLPYILVGKTGKKRYKSISLFALVGILTVIALAGPSWEKLPQPVFQKQSALVIAFDLSYSMHADDVKPSRLEHARYKIADLLDLRNEGQTALLVYAGDAFTVTPLTNDVKTIKSQLAALSPDIMPVPGSDTRMAINKAAGLLKQAGNSQGHILLVTDEVDDKYATAFTKAKTQGYSVSILAVGTEEGVPVKLKDGQFLKDHAGTIVIPILEQNNLRSLVNMAGGRYELSRINDADIERLSQLFNSGPEKSEETESEFENDQWHEFGPWLILFIIPIVAFGFRRGYLSIVFCAVMFNPDQALAFEWDDLWLNKNQQAMRALDNEQAESAAELFQDNAWKAAAKYRAGDFSSVEELLEGRNDNRSVYNRANSLAKQGRYEEAIAAYEEVLKNKPEHEDAKFNKQLVEKELEKQQSQQNQQGQQNQQQSDKNAEQQGSGSQNAEQKNSTQQDSQKQQQSDSEQQSPGSESQQSERQKKEDNAKQQQVDAQDEKQEQAEQQQAQEQKPEEGEQAQQEQSSQQAMNELDEEQQASEQWLRRIPDDPAGLLRRKFKYQYQQYSRQAEDEKYW